MRNISLLVIQNEVMNLNKNIFFGGRGLAVSGSMFVEILNI